MKRKNDKGLLKKEAFSIIDTAETENRALTDEEKEKLEEIESEMKADEEEPQEEEKPQDEPEKEDKEEEKSEDKPEDEEEKEDRSEDEEKEPEDKPEEEEKSDEEEEPDGKKEERNITNTFKSNKVMKEFRLLGAIRDIANNRSMDEASKAVANAGAEEMRKAGLSFGGQIQLPIESRTIAVQGEGGVHGDIIETEFTNILEPLRAKNVLVEAGAKFMTNLVGDVQVPVMGKTNVGWSGEVSEATSGDPAFSHVVMSPKRLTAYIDLSKQFLAQDSLGAENLIREDIVKALNNKLEETILGAASGTTTQPEGMFYTISATQVTNFADVCNKEAELEDANVYGDKIYVLSNKAKAAFRNMAKSTKSTQLVMENGEIDGTKAINTSMIADKKYLYGDFSNLIIGQWGAIDLTVDPYTLARSGQVRLVINAYFDAKVVRPDAFTAGVIA